MLLFADTNHGLWILEPVRTGQFLALGCVAGEDVCLLCIIDGNIVHTCIGDVYHIGVKNDSGIEWRSNLMQWTLLHVNTHQSRILSRHIRFPPSLLVFVLAFLKSIFDRCRQSLSSSPTSSPYRCEQDAVDNIDPLHISTRDTHSKLVSNAPSN